MNDIFWVQSYKKKKNYSFSDDFFVYLHFKVYEYSWII